MRKWSIGLIVLIVLGIAGYYGYDYARGYVADRVMDQVIVQVMQDEGIQQLLEDPEIARLLEEAAVSENIEALHQGLSGQLGGEAGGSGGASAGEAGGAAGGKVAPRELVVRNVEEAQSLVLDKFSAGAIREYAGMARGGLTDEERAVLEEEVMSKFTADELESLKLVALMEMRARQQ
jgi:hypothetical protein